MGADAAAVQADLAERHLPSLSTLRQGVIVLSRQWKNILYTPLLFEHNFKSKVMKPLNVTFALPNLMEDSAEGWQEYQLETEVLDENCLLLDMEVDKLNMPGGVLHEAAGDSPRPHSHPSSAPPSVRGSHSARGSLAFPTLPFSTRKPAFHDDAIAMIPTFSDYGTLKEDLPMVGSNPSLYSPHGSDENIKNDRAREDLYQWMAKQEPIKVETKSKKPHLPPSMTPRLVPLAMPACSLYPLQGSLMLLDAHLVFQPLLAALGVSPHQVASRESTNPATGSPRATSPALESLGSRLSLVAWMEMLRIHIIVSDLSKHDHRKTKGKNPQTHSELTSEAPAFLCEKVSIDVDLKKVADMAVDDLIQRQNVLYISRGQLKKHISTMVNFNISVRFISQQVNMPLLRLLHQISNMYQNVKDTQIELRSQTKISHRQDKHASSSVSDFQENLVSVTSLEKDAQYAAMEPKWDVLTPLPSAPDRASWGTQKSTTPQPVRSRPQSFAQKLRSTGKTVKGKLGYSSLNEGAHTPMFPPTSPPASPAPDGKLTPRCWRTLYLLLELYAAMPDASTITHR
ncbi:unnamed protein product [Plutella xylostella]|uniref:(diamondback moth) hypothetical protein n=1 Tax=Plutella xylostella TaxID=51655 RepID=A0A8S4DE80_PLUXY|nr:unnamed protein product [Plutella xylostella]